MEPSLPAAPRLPTAARSAGMEGGLTTLIALLEFSTPAQVVFGILYVIPLGLGAPRRSRTEALRYLALTGTLTLLNLVVPLVPHDWSTVLADRLLVCLSLGVTTALGLSNRALQEQRVALEVRLGRADLRREFIAALAHDLKTPVLGTIATARLLAVDGKGAGPDLRRRGLAAILSSQGRALRQIEDLLQVFRAEQHGLPLRREVCPIESLAEAALESVRPLAREREITLILERPAQKEEPLTVHGDRAGLRRLLENLLINAVNHCLRGERVWLSLDPLPGLLRIVVSDGGRGFPPEALPHLFDRFYQAEAESGGSGLGLYLCRQITEAHGGTIEADNLPGGGGRIRVLLPRLLPLPAGPRPCAPC